MCEYLAGENDQVILAFSCGKDSIGAWLQLRRFFRRIVPYYCYLIPDLEFVERSLAYYEDFFETKICRLPHPSLYRMLNNLVFQAPENCAIIEEMDLPDIDYGDIREVVVKDNEMPRSTYVANGTRLVDSLARRIAMKRFGPINRREKKFYPIFDWRKERLTDELRRAGVRLPVDYLMFGRSFDGIDYRFLKPVADKFPKDYKKILEIFPLAELELRRREFLERYYETQRQR